MTQVIGLIVFMISCGCAWIAAVMMRLLVLLLVHAVFDSVVSLGG